MKAIPFEAIQSYRARTFRLLPGQRLTSPEQAIDYVNERGFIYFWPITGIPLPSLWSAVAGDRPVADAHDDPGHISWSWKDDLLGKRQWFYAKVLRKKATIIANWLLPSFYALSENYGSPEEDYLTLYEQGRLTQEARSVYEAILDEGPLDTITLRRLTRLSSRESDGRFNKAITDLQVGFKIMPVGVARAGGWNYAFIYDIVAHYLPDLLDHAQAVSDRRALHNTAEAYFRSVGAAQLKDLCKLFGWRVPQAEKAVQSLLASNLIHGNYEVEGKIGEWFITSEIIESK